MTASHDCTPSSPQTSSESSYDIDSDIASYSFCRVIPDDTDTMTSSSSSSCVANSSDDSCTSFNVLPSAVVRRLNAIYQLEGVPDEELLSMLARELDVDVDELWNWFGRHRATMAASTVYNCNYLSTSASLSSCNVTDSTSISSSFRPWRPWL